jgi:ATP-dependent Lon protease
MVVLAGRIPQCDDPDMQARLASYMVLTRPLPLFHAPSEDEIDEIERRMPRASAVCQLLRRRTKLAKCLNSPIVRLSPTLFVGPPGCGKSWLAGRLGRLRSPSPLVYSCAGANSGIPVTGTPRTFRESGPGIAIDAIVRAKVANPCVIWDEIDKAGTSDYNGNFHSALLIKLERETSKTAYDDFLMTTVDLSYVIHIATANDTRPLPKHLLSRFEVINIPPPREDEIDLIVEGFRSKFAEEYDVEIGRVPDVSEVARERLKRQLKKSGDLRDLRRLYEDEMAAVPITPTRDVL